MEDAAASARSTLGQWWEQMRTAVDDRFTGLRNHADDKLLTTGGCAHMTLARSRGCNGTHRPAAPMRAG